MMSKKGLLKFVKYTLIFSNAFGFILSIFLGLFGIAYPDKHFPLSYKGREMALCSLFCMLFTTIGYCGAQNHRRILLIIYGATNVIIVIIVVILWFLFRENSILGNKEISNMFITTLAITIAVMFLFSFILAFHIQTFKEDSHDSIVSQSQQLLQQTTAFLQQQQQHHHHQQQHHLPASFQSGSGGMSSMHHQTSGHLTDAHHLMMPANQSHLSNHLGPTPHQQLQLMSTHQQLAQTPSQSTLMANQQQQQMKQKRIKSALQQTAALMPTSSAAALQLPPPQLHSQALLSSSPQVPQSSSQPAQQLSLTRNQSSPLPNLGISAYQQQQQASSSRSTNKQVQQHYQAQKQPPSSINIPPSPSPPPMHHHSMRDHHRMTPAATSRLPSCPVQYCTFQCDRTV